MQSYLTFRKKDQFFEKFIAFQEQQDTSCIGKWKLTPGAMGESMDGFINLSKKWHSYEAEPIMFVAGALACNELRMSSLVGLIY